MRKSGFVASKQDKKPMLLKYHKTDRLRVAKARLNWRKKFRDGIVYIDQACGTRSTVGRCIREMGAKRPIKLVEDKKASD